MVTDWRTKLRREMNDLDTGAVARAVDSLLNYETVKYFGAEEREAARYGGAVGRYADAAVKNETSLAWLNIGQSLITNVMMAGAMGFVVWGWSKGRFTTGDVVVVNTLLAQLFRPLDLLGMVYRTIRQGLIDMDAMFALIDTPAEVVDAPGAPDLQVAAGHVRFEDVHFGYEPAREILKGIDLEVKPGTMTAVVGPSGAGKSTLSRLLFRFYEPTVGPDHHRRPGYRRGDPEEPARRDRHRPAGHGAVQRHDRLQYRLRQRGRGPGRDRGGGQGRGDPRFHRQPAAGL